MNNVGSTEPRRKGRTTMTTTTEITVSQIKALPHWGRHGQ